MGVCRWSAGRRSSRVVATNPRMTKLLIVDDHAGVRTMIRQLAALPDHAVCECASGEEAVRLAREFAPDVVTMDLNLPGLGGLAATDVICGKHPAIQVVIVSAYDQPELRTAARGAGAMGFIAKDNLGELRGWLSNRASARPAAIDATEGRNLTI